MTTRRSTHDMHLESLHRHDVSTLEGRGNYLNTVRSNIWNVKADAVVDYLMPLLDDPTIWTSYKRGDKLEATWLPNEFDYFLAAMSIDPRWVASQFRQADLDAWAKLVRAGTRPSGRYAKNVRRDVDEVAGQIRAHIVVGGPAEKQAWVDKARAGFESRPDQAVATNKARLAEAKRLGSVRKVAQPNAGRVIVNYTRNGKSETVTQADAIIRWLEKHPDVARLVRRRLK